MSLMEKEERKNEYQGSKTIQPWNWIGYCTKAGFARYCVEAGRQQYAGSNFLVRPRGWTENSRLLILGSRKSDPALRHKVKT